MQAPMQTYGLYDIVKQRIYDKWCEADAFLQDVLRDYRTPTVSSQGGKIELGISKSESAFKSAVLATYRHIRAKLDYQKGDKRTEFKQVVDWINDVEARKKMDAFLLTPDTANNFKSDSLKDFIQLHLLNGEFLELDGITKFEFADNKEMLFRQALSVNRYKRESNK